MARPPSKEARRLRFEKRLATELERLRAEPQAREALDAIRVRAEANWRAGIQNEIDPPTESRRGDPDLANRDPHWQERSALRARGLSVHIQDGEGGPKITTTLTRERERGNAARLVYPQEDLFTRGDWDRWGSAAGAGHGIRRGRGGEPFRTLSSIASTQSTAVRSAIGWSRSSPETARLASRRPRDNASRSIRR